MALVVGTLAAGIQAAMALGIVPPPAHAASDVIASALSSAYDAYARAAQSCALLTPTQVNTGDLEDGLKAALSEPATAQQAAEKWAQAHYDYWDGALFGLTGAVVAIGGKGALELGLAGIFANTANTLPLAATSIAAQLDVFTKTVMVADTLLPAPPGLGCGPLAVV